MNCLTARMSCVPKRAFDSDELWMREALRQTQRALEAGEVPVGAAVVHEARNINTANFDPTAYAEVVRAKPTLGGVPVWPPKLRLPGEKMTD